MRWPQKGAISHQRGAFTSIVSLVAGSLASLFLRVLRFLAAIHSRIQDNLHSRTQPFTAAALSFDQDPVPLSVTVKGLLVESLFVMVRVAVLVLVPPGVKRIVIVVVPVGPVTEEAGVVVIWKSLEFVPLTLALSVRSAPPLFEIVNSRLTGEDEVVVPKSTVPPFDRLDEFTDTLMDDTALVVVLVLVLVPVLVDVEDDEDDESR